MELGIRNRACRPARQGFTLIELLVAVAIFGLIAIVLGGITTASIKSQRKAFSLQNVQESGRYLLESISKELRMSTINSAAGSGLIILNITNSQGQTLDYQFDNTNKRLLRGGQIISPDNLEMTGAFYLTKESFPARNIVTMVMKIKSSSATAKAESEIYLQSTITSRNY